MKLGDHFARLTVLGLLRDMKGMYKARVRCKCGTELIVRRCALVTGNTKSCGCYKTEKIVKHGHCLVGNQSKTYKSYYAMLTRCYNPKHSRFKDYGGRGIKVCDRWRYSFTNFLNDMGPRPKGKTLDRVLNDRDYSFKNCKWSTAKQQAANRRRQARWI